MRAIIIQNKKLKDLLEKKTEAVISGREISEEIEQKEMEMKKIDEEIQGIEKSVDLKDLENKAKAVTDKMNAVYAEMQAVEKEIFARLKSKVPPDLGVSYDEKKRVKEQWEQERNRMGLKIEKIKDLLIPLIKKQAKPLLNSEFEDVIDARLENGEVIFEIVDYIDQFKEAKRKQLAIKSN
jgi:hypothetical protein